MESEGVSGVVEEERDHNTKSVLTVKNNELECCPIHGSVAFHPCQSTRILIISFEVPSDSAQRDRKKRQEERKRMIDRKKNREK